MMHGTKTPAKMAGGDHSLVQFARGVRELLHFEPNCPTRVVHMTHRLVL